MNNWVNEKYSTEDLIESGTNEIWIKRDDLIHPIISGNKWRKLKYALKEALDKNISHVITYGGAYSNHGLAAACACANFNLKCSILIRGEEPPNPNHYTLLQKSFGANLVYVSRTDYKNKEEALSFVEFNPEETLIIPEGGAHPLAKMGCAEIISSLSQTYDYLFLASGTGTTALGVANEIEKEGLATQLIVAPVLKNENEIKNLLAQFSFATVLEGAHLGGYAKTNKSVFKCIENILDKTGILLDPIYTAKAYIAMKAYMDENRLNIKKVLFLHTGGQMGLFSQPMLSKWSENT